MFVDLLKCLYAVVSRMWQAEKYVLSFRYVDVYLALLFVLNRNHADMLCRVLHSLTFLKCACADFTSGVRSFRMLWSALINKYILFHPPSSILLLSSSSCQILTPLTIT